MSTKREQLLDAALALFNERGFRATGIDAILARAGVAKMTLYKHFGSKEELVFAALRRADERWRRWMAEEVEARASDPRGRLLAVFDFAGNWFARPDFHGCMFVRASGEFGDAGDPARAACVEHNRLIERYLARLCADAGAAEPEGLAQELMLLFLGAVAAAQASGEAGSAGVAARAAAALLDRRLPPPTGRDRE